MSEVIPALSPTVWEEIAERRRPELRRLVDESILPLVEEAERKQQFPTEVISLLGEAGFLRIGAPESEGGEGGGRTAEVMVVEELTRAGAGITMSVVPFFIVRIALWEFGTRAAIDEVGVPMSRGGRVVGICMSEPDAGSDVAAISTRAVPDGEGWRITGNKMFITNGTIATDLLVAAKTSGAPGGGGDGVGLFLMSTDQPGYSAKKLDKEGSRASDTTELVLQDCYVPAHRVVGSPTGGFRQAMRVLNGERILSAARAIQLARDSWTEALTWARTHDRGDGPVLGFQSHQGPLAAAAGELWMLELALRETCRLWDTGEPAVQQIAMLKTLSSTMSVRITRDLERLVGVSTQHRGHRIARDARDARIGTVAAGSEQIMHRLIAKQQGWPLAPH